jgi:hypothetical protein
MSSISIAKCFFVCVLFTFLFLVQIEKMPQENVSEDLFALACLPDKRVRVYSACIVDGVRYHTVDREKNRRTQNSGITCEGYHDDQDIDFYGQLKSIFRLQYNSSNGIDRSVVLFQCDWFDVTDDGIDDDGHFISINTSRFWYKSDPFILTSEASKVFYIPDTRLKGKWQVVQRFQHRHLWSVTETDIEKAVGDAGLTHQDEEANQIPLKANETLQPMQTRLRRNQERVLVDAAIVEGMRKKRKVVVGTHEDDEVMIDDTMDQYCSDHEDNGSGHRVPACGIDDDE